MNSFKSLLGIFFAFTLSVGVFADETTTLDEHSYGTFAAIAYSPQTGAYGYSWNQPNRAWAERVAMSHCRAYDCRPVVWVSGGCAAISRSIYTTMRYGWGYAGNRYQAEHNSLLGCQRANLGPCRMIDSVCSY